MHEWGFKYLKLDFLHSPGVEAQRFDLSFTRAEALALFLDTVKAAAGPGVFILGCGLPMGPGLGQVGGGASFYTSRALSWGTCVFAPVSGGF